MNPIPNQSIHQRLKELASQVQQHRGDQLFHQFRELGELLVAREVDQLLSTQDSVVGEQCRLRAQAYREFLRLLQPKLTIVTPNA